MLNIIYVICVNFFHEKNQQKKEAFKIKEQNGWFYIPPSIARMSRHIDLDHS